MDELRFKKPASVWEEALPLGNGFLGAMVYGKTDKELIEMNEDSLWTGMRMERYNPLSREKIGEIRELLKFGKVEEGQRLAERSFFASTPHSRHYQPLGQVWLQFDHKKQPVNYERKLDLEQALLQIRHEMDGCVYERESFLSYPDQVFVYQINAERGGEVNFDLYLTRRDTRSGKTVSYLESITREEECIYLTGYNGNRDAGIEFTMGASVVTTGGTVCSYGSRLAVEHAKQATIYVVGRTSYRSENPKSWCEERLKQVMQKSYSQLKTAHIQDYQNYYNRVELKFDGDSSCEKLSVPERLRNIRSGADDPALVSLYYNFGRYLMISSSREGSLPANLQGIWANEFEPSWGSKYTININIQMNYWMCEKSGLTELHLPLMEHLKTMFPRGREAARNIYGLEGVCAHHVTDIWGDCAPTDYNGSSTIWPYGFVWLCLHVIEHFEYTGDQDFMREYYTILEENVKFLLGYLYLDGSGYYATGPSVSPENVYITEDGQKASVCCSPAMDIEIIREFFLKYLEVCTSLGMNTYTEAVKEHLEKLPPIKKGKYGQIMEWQEDYEEEEPGHRHISQLFALYPGTQIDRLRTPELAEAAAVTLERRLMNGGGHTGWSCAWIIHFYARLFEGEKSYKMLRKLFTDSTLDNLLDNCPPFVIDGNFGGANAILEMLVQDYGERVVILPALPKELKTGYLKGIRLKNGAALSMSWKEGKLCQLEIRAERDLQMELFKGCEAERIELAARQIYRCD